MNILVTGSSGFIGSNLVARLLKEGHRVVGIDKMPFLHLHQIECDESLFSGFMYDLSYANDTTYKALSYFIKEYKIELVYHLAAIANPKMYVTMPLSTIKNNLLLGLNVFESIIDNKIKLVYTSTSEIYGVGDYGSRDSVSEDSTRILDTPGVLRWVYADSKNMLEHFLFAFKKEKGYNDFIIYRLFNVVGKGIGGISSIGTVFNKMINDALDNEVITVTDEGNQKRTFCHIDDILNWFTIPISCVAEKESLLYGEVFNLGNPENEISMKQLAMDIAEAIFHRTDKKIEIEYVAGNKFHGKGYSEIMRSRPDISKITNRSMITPSINLKTIIEEIVDYVCNQKGV